MRFERETKRAGERWQDTGYVFVTGRGTPFEPRNVTRYFGETLKAQGFDHIRLHDARHTAATLLLAQGVPIKVISEILGHARTSITHDLYAHVIQSQQQAAARTMDDILSEDNSQMSSESGEERAS